MRRPDLVVAETTHAVAMAAIHAASFPPPERWGADAITLQLGLPGAFGWLDAGGSGFVLARVAADEAEILTLAVLPGVRRAGHGRTLLTAALASARTRGARRMVLEVGEANHAARSLYATLGFSAAGRRARYYPNGADALVLAATLDDQA